MERVMTYEEYEAAMIELATLALRDPPADSEDGKRLLALVDKVEAYERERWPAVGS